MRCLCLSFIVFIFSLSAAQAQNNYCTNEATLSPLEIIEGCTNIINKTKKDASKQEILARAYYNRGTSYDYMAKYTKAIEDYNQVINLEPKNILAFKKRGLALQQVGKKSRALKDYNYVLRLNSNDAEIYMYRGVIFRDMGKYDKAFADFNSAGGSNANSFILFYHIGETWRKKGEYDKAIANFNKAIKLDEEFSYSYFYRGLTWYAKGAYDKAIEDYDEFLTFSPTKRKSATYFNRGKAWHKKGMYKKAIKDYDEALKINPNNRGAHEKREIALQQIQKKFPKTTEVELEFWKSVRDTKDPDELKAYIEAYPNGKFSPIAKLRMQKLK